MIPWRSVDARPEIYLRALSWPAALEKTAVGIGSPDTIVLLHGLGDTADIWRPLMSIWRPPAPVLAFDLPGHGKSFWQAPGSYSVAAMAGHVSVALAEQGMRRPLLIGHSLGAWVSVDLAGQPALSVQGCIAIDIGTDPGAEVETMLADHIDALRAGRDTRDMLAALILERLPLADPAAVAAAIKHMAVRANGRWHVQLDPEIKHLLTRKLDSNIWHNLAKVRSPFGLVRGAYSAVLNRAAAAKIVNTIPHKPVPLHEVRMAGHAIPLEQPASLAQALDACLSQMPGPGFLV